MPYSDITGTIGRTPIVRLNRIADGHVFVKLESRNPGGSSKDRAALFMLRDAESKGLLKKGGTIVEPTSGNTGIGLAMVSAALGYHLIVVMPDTMSEERIRIMEAYGAEVVSSPGKDGMDGSVKMAEKLAKEKNAFMPLQFDNPNNVMAHYVGTAKEILEDIPDIGFVVAGIGTGGTATGIGKALKESSSKAKVIGVEPAESPLISAGKAGPHRIQGIGANFIPGNLDMDCIESVITVAGEDAVEMTRRLAREEGILAGISSGAAVCAALRIAEKNKGEKVLAILPDTGERYMSTGIF